MLRLWNVQLFRGAITRIFPGFAVEPTAPRATSDSYPASRNHQYYSILFIHVTLIPNDTPFP